MYHALSFASFSRQPFVVHGWNTTGQWVRVLEVHVVVPIGSGRTLRPLGVFSLLSSRHTNGRCVAEVTIPFQQVVLGCGRFPFLSALGRHLMGVVAPNVNPDGHYWVSVFAVC